MHVVRQSIRYDFGVRIVNFHDKLTYDLHKILVVSGVQEPKRQEFVMLGTTQVLGVQEPERQEFVILGTTQVLGVQEPERQEFVMLGTTQAGVQAQVRPHMVLARGVRILWLRV